LSSGDISQFATAPYSNPATFPPGALAVGFVSHVCLRGSPSRARRALGLQSAGSRPPAHQTRAAGRAVMAGRVAVRGLPRIMMPVPSSGWRRSRRSSTCRCSALHHQCLASCADLADGAAAGCSRRSPPNLALFLMLSGRHCLSGWPLKGQQGRASRVRLAGWWRRSHTSMLSAAQQHIPTGKRRIR
jgi:hypothetical protein